MQFHQFPLSLLFGALVAVSFAIDWAARWLYQVVAAIE